MDNNNVGRVTGLGCAVHHGNGGCPGYPDNAASIGYSGQLAGQVPPLGDAAAVRPTSEIDQELNWNADLIAQLEGVIASLADRLKPVLIDMPVSSNSPQLAMAPRNSRVARQLADQNMTFEMLTNRLHAIRDDVHL